MNSRERVMLNAVDVEDLAVVRGGNDVLQEVTLHVPAGRITGLLGPSGSGKTTLMRCIVGVQVVRSGRVRVLGQPAGSPALRSQIGYVTQSPSVYSDLTVLENLRYFARLYGPRAGDVDATVDQVGLAGQRRQLVRTLSGGQLSRCSLACALVGRPELLVLDEPTVGQDPLLRDELWGHFRRLADDGATLIVSSHVMDEANRCDSLVLVRNGQVLAEGTPDGVRAAAGTTDLDAAFLALVRSQQAA